MSSILDSLRLNPPFAIIGTGMTGASLSRLLKLIGVAKQQICTFDAKDSRADFNDPSKMLAEFQPQTLFVSPGVPLVTPWIQSFEKAGGRISSELEVAFAHLTSETVIAVTGSIGKSTTAALIGAAAQEVTDDVFVGGNFGVPLADYVYDLLAKQKNTASFVVLELSSYQLENFRNLSADISVLTYLSPNHLERYNDLEDYYQTKLELLRRTKKHIVANKNGGDCYPLLSLKNFAPLKISWTSRESEAIEIHGLDKSLIIGEHNRENLAMAAQVAEILAWPEKSYAALKKFPGLPHRLENCGIINGVHFINDSKATAMDSVLQATLSVLPLVGTKNSLHLLLGGRDKNLPWAQLSELKNNSKIHFTFFGEFASSAKSQSKLEGPSFPKLKPALDHVFGNLKPGDVLLLSPGGSSLDEFKGFDDRGNYFKAYLKSYFQDNI